MMNHQFFGKLAAGSLISLMALVLFAAPARAAATCPDGITCLDQNWTSADRTFWYRTSQGSRLIPLKWMQALQEANGEELFLSPDNVKRYGYLAEPVSPANPLGLPIGFVVDHDPTRAADLMCETFPEICAGRVMRKPWLGLNCAACHTSDITYNGQTVRVQGAPAMADFQTMLEELHAALDKTSTDDGRFTRFADRVLGQGASADARKKLKIQVAELAAYRAGLLKLNQSDVRYGYGRLDAQGHILNKVALVGKGGGGENRAIKSDAPASYPHIWNTSQQDKIQWNGIAGEIVKLNIFGKNTDVGGLLRNVTEVIGVFAHLEINSKWKPAILGYDSSVRVKQMIDLEQTLEKLGSPLWPESVFGQIDRNGMVEKGREQYVKAKCNTCHADIAKGDITTPIKVTMSKVEAAGTDVMLACNTVLHTASAGLYENRRPFIIKGDKIKSPDATVIMLKNAAVGTMIGKLDEILTSVVGDVVGGFRSAAPEESGGKQYLPGAESALKKDLAKACLKGTDAEGIVAYKARPLNGIWATAPYLHNGSVPTLYDLLLPSHLRTVLNENESMPTPKESDRPLSFNVGSREFDAEKVGFVTDDTPVATLSDGTKVPPFKFDVVDDQKRPIPGNYNSGHDYGTADLSHDDRMELIEYLKTL